MLWAIATEHTILSCMLTAFTELVPSGQTPDLAPFIEQLAALKSDKVTLELFWQIQYEGCDLPVVSINTPDHTLYPVTGFVIPIELNNEYNVSVKDVCYQGPEVDITEVNVTVSILLSDNVLENVPYIVCIITRIGSNTATIRSREVYLHSYHYITTTHQDDDDISTTQIFKDIINSDHDCVPCAACRPYQIPAYLCTFIILITDLLYRVLW